MQAKATGICMSGSLQERRRDRRRVLSPVGHQSPCTIMSQNNRRRALDQLRQMEERNRALEERAVAAEARAREAEKWLMRLHVEMEDKFVSWRGLLDFILVDIFNTPRSCLNAYVVILRKAR